MISGKQFKNMVDYMFSGIPGFVEPTATLNAVPDTYVTSAVPASIALSGVITPNDGVITTWAITAGTSPTVLATGTGNTPTHTVTGVDIPTTAGSYIYYLTVTYTDSNSASQSFVVSTTVVVTAAALFGQLTNPTDDITVDTDLTPAIEATLTSTSKADIINLFTVTAANTARILFVIPDSYGSVTSLEDGAGLNVLNQFNAVTDVANNRIIYTALNTVVPGTYDYKFVF